MGDLRSLNLRLPNKIERLEAQTNTTSIHIDVTNSKLVNQMADPHTKFNETQLKAKTKETSEDILKMNCSMASPQHITEREHPSETSPTASCVTRS